MNSSFEDNSNCRTLYIGNLDPSVTEDLLMALFGQIGSCTNCKIIHDPSGDPYAFIEFTEHQAAANAILAMNKRSVIGREIKVNWATTSSNATNKIDTNKHFHIFVGDLAPEIDQNALREVFSPFGEISEIKIAKFVDTQKPKGYCFISFVNQNDAETAITSMNGQWIGTRKIRTNWATRKGPTNETISPGRNRDSNHFQQFSPTKLDFNEVWNRTTDTNSTVYFGNCGDINDDLVRSLFKSYGRILEIRVFKEKGYAFIRFATKDNACQAICHLHGSNVYGHTVKCGWGRDESTNTGNFNNQYNSFSQNSYGPSLNNNTYMGGTGGNYSRQQWNNDRSQSWNTYSQSVDPHWDNNNNNNFYGPNSNQYYGQQSNFNSQNCDWGPSAQR